jgi:hypothetical protein
MRDARFQLQGVQASRGIIAERVGKTTRDSCEWDSRETVSGSNSSPRFVSMVKAVLGFELQTSVDDLANRGDEFEFEGRLF